MVDGMVEKDVSEPDGPLDAYKELVQRVVDGPVPAGDERFDGCRAVLRLQPDSETAFAALCMLLEGALADPDLSVDDTQTVVPLHKALARGTVRPGELL